MGTNGPSGNFDIHNFFKNPLPLPQGSAYPPSGHSLHSFPHNNFALGNAYSTSPYSNLAASYPYGPQNSSYNHHSPYPQDQVPRGPPYPTPGFGQPGFSGAVPSPLPLSNSVSQASSPNPSSPALDSAHLMALLTNSSTGIPNSNLHEHPSTDLELKHPPAAMTPAAPSAPPVNLAPNSSSGRLVKSKFARGRHLKGEHVIYDIDIRVAGEAQPQLEHNTITKYLSDPQVILGRQIAVNKSYICYALRATKGIRILNINTALKHLLRGHSQGRVTDMAFYADNVHLLASASTDGKLFVRKIVEGPGEDNKVQIWDQILLAIQFTGNWDCVHPRICWHAHTEDLIVIAMANYVFTIDIKKVRQCAAPDGFSIEQPLVCPVDSPVEGVHCAGKHLKEVTDLSTSQWTRLVSASKDGTVHIWHEQNILPSFTLTPHDGLSVDAVALLSAPHRNDHVVLLTAGPSNRELKLWVPSGGEGWFPRLEPISWNCIQTLELKSSSTEDLDAAFFNQVLVVPRACVILLPNARRKALYVVHLDFGANPSATRMNYLAEFLVMMPIFSVTATSENVFDGEGVVQVYCVQTEAIQQYTLDLSLCVPTIESAACNMVEKDLKGSLGGPTTNLEASSTALEVSAMLRAKSPGPISGVSLTDNILGGHNAGTISVDSATSPDKRLGVSSASKDINELSMNNLSSNMPQIIAPTPQVGAVVLSPRGSSGAKSNVKPSTANSPRNELEFVHFEQNEEDKNGSDAVHDSYPLSPRRPPNEVMRISEDRDWQVISTSPASSIMTDQNVGLSSVRLITPSELMSMAARSKGEVGTGGSGLSSPRRTGGKNKELTKSDSRVEDYLEKEDLEVLTVETKEVTESSLLFPASTSLEKEASSRSQGASDAGQRDHTKTTSEIMCMDILKDEKDLVDQLQFDPASRGTPALDDEVEDPLNVPVVDELCEQLKEVSMKVDEPSALQVSQNRKKKNKNKADVSVSNAMALPTTQLPVASTSAQYMSDQELAVNSSNISPPLSAIAAQVFSLQESVNQLVCMQRDFQKQLATILAVPIAKEVKKMEVSLGQRMEKLLKAHTDAIWARLQEDNVKREKLERDRAQQLTSLVTNYLSKEIPGALDKSLKKEFSSIGSYVTRLLIPSIEKAITSAVNESFQKGVAEKGVAQLEKSLTPKIEALVSRLLQTQFQTCGKQVLQDGLRSCLEVSVVPAFERACKEMFVQVDAAFQNGLLEHQTQAQQQLASSQNALITSLQETISQASSLAGYMKGDLTDGHRKLLAAIESASSGRLPKATISGSLPEKAMTVERVEESLDPTKELSRLVSEHKLEEAFNKALSLTDVGVVSWLCNQVDPATLFTMSPPPLSQGVILALVQQLGCDLGNDTSKKLMWIKDAGIALNPHDPLLAPHMRHFLEKLYANLHALAKTSLSPELANLTRLVMYVVHSLLSMCK